MQGTNPVNHNPYSPHVVLNAAILDTFFVQCLACVTAEKVESQHYRSEIIFIQAHPQTISKPNSNRGQLLLAVLQKSQFSQKDQSPCHHQTPQILLSLLPLSSPQLGQQRWRGQDLLLVQH